jgi:hypothetical protein
MPNKPKNENTDKKVKNMNMNVKFPEDDYRELQQIADDLGGMSLSSMVRMLIYKQLEKVRKTKDPKSFLEIKK